MTRAFGAYLAAFGGTIALSAVAARVLLASRPDLPAEALIASLPGIVAGGLASAGSLTAVALAATRPPRAQALGLVAGRASTGAVLVMVIGVLALGQALESLSFVVGVGSRGAVETIRQVLVGLSGAELALAVAVIGLVAGSAEEVFFRGFMQGRLRERWRPAWAIMASAACFGAMHLDAIHATLAFVLGVYLGFLVERAGSVIPAVICHVVNNTTAVTLTAIFGTVAHFWTHLVILLGMSAVFAGSLVLLTAILPPRHRLGGATALRVG
jgi:membrane protease YdiL (CAAX protease family)